MTGQAEGRPGRPAYIAVVGPDDPSEPGKPGDIIEGDLEAAQEAGRLLAAHGAVLLCGGLGGVMEAACIAARGHRPAGVTADPHADPAVYFQRAGDSQCVAKS